MADRPHPNLEHEVNLLVQRVDLLSESLNNYTTLLGDLVKTQENRLTHIEQEFSGLRRETRESSERLDAKVDAVRLELDSKIERSRNWTVGILTVVIALATYLGSL